MEGRPLKSLVDFAVGKDKSAGIAVTCRLWDATPADFVAITKIVMLRLKLWRIM